MVYKRKNYLVKPKLQLKYLALLALIMFVSAILIYYSFLNSLLSSPGMDQLSAGAVKNFVSSYNSGFFWAMLIFAIIVLLGSIFYFHRLIGPIFFFEKVMKQLSEGDFSVTVHHRKKDETIELATGMDKAVSNVRKAISKDRKKIEEIKVAIDNKKIDEAKKLLSELTQWFKIEKK
jgi:methyl-accepting chemotaxis protein